MKIIGEKLSSLTPCPDQCPDVSIKCWPCTFKLWHIGWPVDLTSSANPSPTSTPTPTPPTQLISRLLREVCPGAAEKPLRCGLMKLLKMHFSW